MSLKPEKIFCKICSINFSKTTTLELHSKIVHQNSGTKQKLLLVLLDEKVIKKLTCELCSSIFMATPKTKGLCTPWTHISTTLELDSSTAALNLLFYLFRNPVCVQIELPAPKIKSPKRHTYSVM